MTELFEQFAALPPLSGRDSQLKTLLAVFMDVEKNDAQRVVVAAHHELKNRATERGLMVGEFAPGYLLPSTRNAAVNVGEAPVPVLALRYMLPSDHRFLLAEDHWLAAWAQRFGADRVPLFRAFSTQEMAAIMRIAKIITTAPRAVLCRQGEIGSDLFLILDGEVSVEQNGKTVATRGAGMYFGELALLTSNPRNATVTALTDLSLLVIERRSLGDLMSGVPPVVRTLLTGLAQRVYEVDSEGYS
jgi:hypothetical protein